MVPKPKDAHALSVEILDLEKRLAAARQRWELLWSGTGQTAREIPKRTRTLSSDGISLKALECLEMEASRIFTIGEVASAINESDLDVGRALYRLYKGGKIVNPARGRYQAKDKEVIPEETTS
jgi:hypothetical protein